MNAVSTTLCILAITLSSAQDQESRQDMGVHHFGNTSKPFAYLQATITIPETMPAFNDQYLYFYFGLAKEKLSANVIVLFCGNEEGCWGHVAQPGYNFYAEVTQDEGVGYKHFAGGEKVAIAPGESAQVTIIQEDDYLSLNVTKLNDLKDSFFDIYGSNDGGLVDIIAGVTLQYDTAQNAQCSDYNKDAFVISDILAVESDGTFIKNIDFKQDANNTNTCNGEINIGSYGRKLDLIGSSASISD